MATPKGVIIAGGGPVGLIVGLMLGRAGVKVRLFDQGDIVHQQPRAATIHPATLDILDDLGVYERIEPQGLRCPIVHYYDGKELLAAFDHGLLRTKPGIPGCCNASRTSCRVRCLRWPRMCRTWRSGRRARSSIARRSADGIEVAVEAQGKQERHQAAYLVGADGAGSTVRKMIGVEFEGFTYPERFMIIGTPYDFEQDGYAYRNYISDPDEWSNLFKISWKGPPGCLSSRGAGPAG